MCMYKEFKQLNKKTNIVSRIQIRKSLLAMLEPTVLSSKLSMSVPARSLDDSAINQGLVDLDAELEHD